MLIFTASSLFMNSSFTCKCRAEKRKCLQGRLSLRLEILSAGRKAQIKENPKGAPESALRNRGTLSSARKSALVVIPVSP